MAKSLTVAPLTELSDASVEDYLEYRRPVAHLLDLAPQTDPMAFQPGGADMGAPVYASIRARGDRQTDVRLLADNGERFLALATSLANNLRCDVYLTPDGTHIRYVRESSSVAGDSWDAIAVDRATGEPVHWLVARPDDLTPEVPTWFTSVRGRLRRSNGLVTVTLPDGIAFATKTTFRDTAQMATHLRLSFSNVTTVAVNAGAGAFEICRFDDVASLLDGAEFATLVSACLDVIRPDVQLALTWPTDLAACAALDGELVRFADALDRTVWVPQPHGAAFVLPGCGDFAAVDEVGSPSVWRAYPSSQAEQWRPHYGTDQDGRLVPLGNIVAKAFTGVRFVSVAHDEMARLRPIYETVAAFDGLFAFDLAVLADGRLGVLIETGALLAIGPRELRALLRDAGWSGEDLLLLTQPSAENWEPTVRHVHSLAEALTADIWLPALGAQVWVRRDGRLAAYAPDGTGGPWHAVTYGSPSDLDSQADIRLALPAALSVATRPALEAQSALHELTGEHAIPTLTALSAAAYEPALDAPPDEPALVAPPDEPALVAPESEPAIVDTAVRAPMFEAAAAPEPVDLAIEAVEPIAASPAADLPVPVPVEPIVSVPRRAQGLDGPHAIAWLTPQPVVNTTTIDLYVWAPDADDHVEGWRLPAADLFLVAGQDPLRLVEPRRDGHLLRVCAPPGGAVELTEHAAHSPVAIRARLQAAGVTHLLPLAWLSELRVTARYELDGRGGVHPPGQLDAGALAIRFEGAEHGVPGLPNEVVHWPDKGTRADAPAYLVVPDEPDPGPIEHRGFVALCRVKPALVAGHQLMEIKVRKRKAIDVPATLDLLDGVPVVGRMHDFLGLDLLLPEADIADAVVTKVWRCGPNGKPVRVPDPPAAIAPTTITTTAPSRRS